MMEKSFLGTKEDDGFESLPRLYTVYFVMCCFIKRFFVWLKDWIRYRTTERYHVLKLHDPGYADPTTQMIYAVMGIVERYAHECRINWFGDEDTSNMSDVEVMTLYVRTYRQLLARRGDTSSVGWLNHYMQIRTILFWWNHVKDDPDLDVWTKQENQWLEEHEDYDPVGEHLTSDHVSRMLKLAIENRRGMWT